jgi:hypothetical protein
MKQKKRKTVRQCTVDAAKRDAERVRQHVVDAARIGACTTAVAMHDVVAELGNQLLQQNLAQRFDLLHRFDIDDSPCGLCGCKVLNKGDQCGVRPKIKRTILTNAQANNVRNVLRASSSTTLVVSAVLLTFYRNEEIRRDSQSIVTLLNCTPFRTYKAPIPFGAYILCPTIVRRSTLN